MRFLELEKNRGDVYFNIFDEDIKDMFQK